MPWKAFLPEVSHCFAGLAAQVDTSGICFLYPLWGVAAAFKWPIAIDKVELFPRQFWWGGGRLVLVGSVKGLPELSLQKWLLEIETTCSLPSRFGKG